jgi:beta-galactosidase/beta-glucuronidase
MTGVWRFRLTHGQIVEANPASAPSYGVDGRFTRSIAEAVGIRASSSQSENPPENAFDSDEHTRWCAEGDSFPQWIQADLGKDRIVTGVTLSWERAGETYRCKIEGGDDGRNWKTLADESAGIGSGTLSITPRSVRYVRLVVLGSNGGWASLWTVGIRYRNDQGKETTWTPPKVDLTASAKADEFTHVDYDDKHWNNLTVPSNWEMAGYSLPTYNSVDDTVGLYRRWVTVPASWTGRRIYWRFDGAMDGAEIFVNGHKAGYHESGYTAFDVDLTGLIQPGKRNLFAVRLCKTTPTSECETGDYQTLGGIYRDTELIAVPQTHVADITVRTPLTHNYRDANLDASVVVDGEPGSTVGVAGILLDSNGRPTGVTANGQARTADDGTATIVLSTPVKAPRLWSAEKPNLYYLVLHLTQNGRPVENVEQRFGFRQVEIKGNVVLWNGRPIKCTGICRHDFWADKGFALTDKEWKTDLRLMKAANIDAIRTSHYNHAARFLELCEEQGMYILDEVPFCWVGDKVQDTSFAPGLLLRARDTVERDKNRPCVLAWSLGNENPVGMDTQQVFDLVKHLDPTRPAFASGAGPSTVAGQDLRDDHYPSPETVQRFISVDAKRSPIVITEHPHTLYTKASQDYDPGVSDLWSECLIKTWNVLWHEPHILGSFIWEWQNQGIADKNPDTRTDFWYGLDHLRQENNKGIVSAYRVPKPEWWVVKNIYSPIGVAARTVEPSGDSCTVDVENRYSFTNLDELTCRWTALRGDTVLKSGDARISCAPSKSVEARFPAPAGMTALRLEFLHPDGSDIISNRLTVPGSPTPQPPVALSNGGTLQVDDNAGALTVHNGLESIGFDKATGAITGWTVNGRKLLTGAATLNLGETKTGQWNDYYHADGPPSTTDVTVSAEPQPGGDVRVTVASQVQNRRGGDTLGRLTTTYDLRPDAQIDVDWNLAWTGASTYFWEAGLRLPVNPDLSTMRWYRDSFFTDYPAGHLGEPLGECSAGSTLFWASKSGLHWLTLTDKTGHGLALLKNGDLPLVGRAKSGKGGEELWASAGIAPAGPDDLSHSWFVDRDIVASTDHPLTGAFVLRAIQ